MKTEKRKYKCEGCGTSRPCYVETNQEASKISITMEDLKCILDETNQSYMWEEVGVFETNKPTAVDRAFMDSLARGDDMKTTYTDRRIPPLEGE